MNIPVEVTVTDKEIFIYFPNANAPAHQGNLCIDYENISYDFDKDLCVKKIIMDKDGWSYPSIIEGFESIMVVAVRAIPKGMDNYLKMDDLLIGFSGKGLEV